MPAKDTSAKKPYKEMIAEAIKDSSSRTGVSRQALKKYFTEKYPASSVSHINQAIKNGVKDGSFLQPKGPSGPIKLSAAAKTVKKPTTKKKAATPATATATTKKPAAAAAKKATATTKKAAAPKKVVKKTTKKPAAAAPKKVVKKTSKK